MALFGGFGAFWEGFVTDLQFQKQLITIARNSVYTRRKRVPTGRGTEDFDPPTHQIIHSLIAFKDGKGIKDCRANARSIFVNFLRSMSAGPIHRENSGKPR